MTTMPRRRRTIQERTNAPRVTERAFQSQVEQYARMMGWLVSHAFLSIGSVGGFPDLICLRGGVMVVAELKSTTGKTTEAQELWLFSFRAVPGVTVKLWKPDDDSWADIERTLGR